jgi:regulator of protease activity HflC (stomatin/prohibitin superfamily)
MSTEIKVTGAADFASQLVTAFMPLVWACVSVAFWLLPLAGISYGGYRLYLIALPYYRDSMAHEYMIVIRDGKCIKVGTGIYTITWPGDQVVKFPTIIKKVDFQSEQVTSEMMGIRVSGALYWSPHRDDPFKLYKSFGKELQNSYSNVIDEKLQQMAVAVVRDRVANTTIEAILRDRNQLRSSIKKSMQEMMTGWGMWLETIEISDVYITSGTLFKNMQTEHREKYRLHADKIVSESSNTIRQENLEKDSKLDKERKEVSNKFRKT